MPQGLRLQYPGAIYHVLNRGDQREDIFRDDADREKFLSTLGGPAASTGNDSEPGSASWGQFSYRIKLRTD